MALAAIKTWVAQEVLYAADLVAEFANILNNPISLISPFTSSVDAGGFDITALDEIGLNDASAVPTSARIRRNGNALQWLIEGSHTSSVLNVLSLIATTSGAPAAGIGTSLTLRSESADENPADVIALQGIFTDIGAGTEDSVVAFALRVAGRALDEKYRFASTAGEGFTAIFTHAVTADRTYTLPDATGGVVVSLTTGEILQRATGQRTPTMSADETLGNNTSTAFTFATAFSATPVLVVSGLNTSNTRAVMYTAVSSTAFTPQFEGSASAAIDCTVHFIALGAP